MPYQHEAKVVRNIQSFENDQLMLRNLYRIMSTNYFNSQILMIATNIRPWGLHTHLLDPKWDMDNHHQCPVMVKLYLNHFIVLFVVIKFLIAPGYQGGYGPPPNVGFVNPMPMQPGMQPGTQITCHRKAF